jgi:hypothetical protein
MISDQRRGSGGGGTGQGYGGSSPGQGGGRGGGFRSGPGGMCTCSACGEKVPHQQGTPCIEVKCPKCGAAMIRE